MTSVRTHVFFRITAPLPMVVAFPSVTYALVLESVPMAGRHQLMAHDRERGKWWMIGPWYHAREFLERAVFEIGVPIQPATVAEVVMRRLVRESRAERTPVPSDDLTERRPAKRQPLGSWLAVQYVVEPASPAVPVNAAPPAVRINH